MRLLDLAPILLQTASRVESAFSARFSRRNVQRRNRSSPYAIAKHPAQSGTFYSNKNARKTQPVGAIGSHQHDLKFFSALYTTPALRAIFHSPIHTVDKVSTLIHGSDVFAGQRLFINPAFMRSTLWRSLKVRDIPNFSTRVNSHKNKRYPQLVPTSVYIFRRRDIARCASR